MSYNPYSYGNPMNQQSPSGNVYLVNSFNEAANVPQGFGTTVNLCLNDNIMYIRNNQNILAYKLTPYEPPKPGNQMDERLSNVEKQLKQILDFLNSSVSSTNKTSDPQPTKRAWDV